MKKSLLAAGVFAVALAAASGASAAVTLTFDGGLASPGTGFTVVDQFNDNSHIASGTLGVDYLIQNVSNSQGALPANSVPFGTNYLSVVGGGQITYNFTGTIKAFQFDWGSVDTYNHIVIHQAGGVDTLFDGSGISVLPANYGDQGSGFTNGLFTVKSNDGKAITGFTLSSGTNSYEIDNLAVVAVPEPATWAMMLVGFFGVGGLVRSRRHQAVAA